MSTVTDVMLITGLGENPHIIDLFSKTLIEHGVSEGRSLLKIEECGGSHAFQAGLYVGAYNYLDQDKALEVFRSLAWESPDQVQLMLKYESWDRFKVYSPEPCEAEQSSKGAP